MSVEGFCRTSHINRLLAMTGRQITTLNPNLEPDEINKLSIPDMKVEFNGKETLVQELPTIEMNNLIDIEIKTPCSELFFVDTTFNHDPFYFRNRFEKKRDLPSDYTPKKMSDFDGVFYAPIWKSMEGWANGAHPFGLMRFRISDDKELSHLVLNEQIFVIEVNYKEQPTVTEFSGIIKKGNSIYREDDAQLKHYAGNLSIHTDMAVIPAIQYHPLSHVFAPLRNYISSITIMFDSLHPEDQERVFEEYRQNFMKQYTNFKEHGAFESTSNLFTENDKLRDPFFLRKLKDHIKELKEKPKESKESKVTFVEPEEKED